jgi:CspA family cold shock protein
MFDAALDRHLIFLELPFERPRLKKASNKMGVHLGTVSHFNGAKGFGFIRPDAPIDELRSEDLFIGARALRKTGIKSVTKGDRVSFDIVPLRQKGKYEAANVALAA